MSVRRGSVREIALTVGAALGVCCLLAAVLSLGFGITPLVFRSGSMGPGIPTGALGLARTVPADVLQRGDVVSVPTADGIRVTHRIVAVQPAGGDLVSLTLRGDANRVPDADPYLVRQADRLFWSAPGLGYVVSALSGRPAAFAGGLLCGVLALVVAGRREATGSREGGEQAQEPGPTGRPGADVPEGVGPEGVGPEGVGPEGVGPEGVGPEGVGSEGVGSEGAGSEADRPRRCLPIALGLLVMVALLVQAHPTPANAAWSDSATSSGTLTTVTVPPPALSCTAAITSVTFRWTAVSEASYVLTIRRTNGTVFSTTPIAAGSTSSTASGLLSSGTATIVAVRYTGAWTSVASNSVTFTLGLSCG